MRWRAFLRSVSVALVFLAAWLAMPSYGQETATPKKGEVSTKELSDLVDLLEDPQKREVFLKDVKNLIQLREAAVKEREAQPGRPPEKKEKQVLAIESLFVRFESLSKRIMTATKSTATLVVRAPKALGEAKSFLSRRENQSRLFRLFVDIAGGIFMALVVGLLLRKYVHKMTERSRSLSSKVIIGFVRVILKVVPYGALLISLFILFDVLPSFPLGHALALQFFVVLFFYRIASEVFRTLLSPEEEKIRILPLSDENANYFWVWAGRFTKYAAFYFLVTRTLLAVGMPPPSFSFIRGLLLVVFPIMISVFIMQVARDIRMKYQGARKNEEGADQEPRKAMNLVVRYWSLPAIAYSWAIFIFLIVHFGKGFRYLLTATVGTAITIAALSLALWLLDLAFKCLFAINERIKARFPGLEEKTNRYIRVVRKGLGAVGVIVALGVIAQIWGIPVSAFVVSPTGSLIILRIIGIAITLGVVVAIVETSQFITDYLLQERKGKKKKEPSQKLKTLVPMVRTAIKIAAGFIGGIVILDQLGVNTGPILAGAGIVGLAVGFGSQTLVKDLINGLFILFEESIRVGDVAVIGNTAGIVEAVGLRTIKLRDLAGSLHVIPNSSIQTATNMTKDYGRYLFDVGVAYREDVDEVMEIMREIGEEMQNDPAWGKDILEPLEIFGLQRFDDSAVVIRARVTTKPMRQWAVGREFNRRMKKTFDERGIEIPFPHRTVYMGVPKEGPAAPLHVQMKNPERGQEQK